MTSMTERVKSTAVAPAVDQVMVLRSIRNDPLGAMHANNTVTDLQFQAGRKWQADYERVGVGDWRAMKNAGCAADAFGKTRMASASRLQAASVALGRKSDRLLHSVLGDGNSIKMAAAKRGRGPKGLQKIFCACLTTLADATLH